MTLDSKNTAVTVDRSSGFHVFEFHWATTGMSVFTILLVLGLFALLFICYSWCQRQQRRFNPMAALQIGQQPTAMQPMHPMWQQQMLNQMQMQMLLCPPAPLAEPAAAAQPAPAAAPPPQPFRFNNEAVWRDVH